MKKRILSLLLAVSIACSMLVVPVNAAASNAAVQTAVTLGGLTSEQASALSTALTRGQLAKLLVAFSAYRESAATQGNTGTLFTDVDSGNEYAPYIRIAVQQGWLSGYTDGSFRPDNGVTLEEACTAALKLLGYDVTTLSGSFPAAQLNKAGSLGLRAGLSAVQGQGLTLEDAAVLFYNALTASTAENQTYAATLGFTVTDGRIDLSSVLLSSVEGPFVADGTTQLPFVPAAVYRNDTVATDAALNAYDVYYYSASARTVWIYSRKAAGRITAVSPSASAPTSVTVAGTSYTLASSAAASVLSSLNGGGVGQVVTLLLGMNNEAVAVLTGEEADSVFYGVVQTASRSLTEENGADVLQSVQVACTDGVTRTVNVDKSLNFPAGWLVKITVNADGENVETLNGQSVSGTIRADGTALGDAALASDVEILDTTAEGLAGTVSPSRLSGVTLSDLDVRYYTVNDAGQIDRLILNDVTGDLWSYGVLDDVKNLAMNYSDLKSLVTGIAAGDSASGTTTTTGTTTGAATGGTDGSGSTSDTTTTVTGATAVDRLSNLLVPTTSEILWGIVSGDILSTAWQKLTSNTGSLMSIRKNVQDIVIPSEERHIKLHPMDFEEFLWALGNEVLMDFIRLHFEKRKPMEQAMHRKAMDYFRQYLIVGGMPQAVAAYVQTHDFDRVDRVKRDILELYRADIVKHAEGYEMKVAQIFDDIPAQLQKHEKKKTTSSTP